MQLLQLFMTLIVPISIDAKKSELNFWQYDGDMCNAPQGSYKNNCFIEKIEPFKDENGNQLCKFTTFCNMNDQQCFKPFSYEYPIGITPQIFLGDTLQPEINIAIDECPTCEEPKGNYIDSCYRTNMSYDESSRMCIFSAYCDPLMQNKETLRNNRNCKLTQMQFPANETYTNLKNFEGDFVHPNNINKPIACPIDDEVAADVLPCRVESSGGANKIDRKVLLTAGLATLALTF